MRRVSSRGTKGAPWVALLIVVLAACGALMRAQDAGGRASQQGAAAAQSAAPEPAANPAATAQESGKNDSGLYVFKAEVQEVVLHATVTDEHHHLVTDLDRSAFHIFDNGVPQQIHSFRREDAPVALGIVIDNSGSMRDKRPSVNEAALDLVKASNPQDQVFVVNFNNDYYLDQDYTGDVSLLRTALEHIESRGGTALYDALVATSDHLMKSAKLQKKAILVVTDGEDNASHDTLEQAVRAIAVDGGPAVYSIGLLGHEKEKKARRALRILSEQTGGAAYFPTDLSQIDAISQQIAHDIRNQYMIGYEPSAASSSSPLAAKLPGYHQIVVKAEARGYKGLAVRTRSGYYVNGGRPAAR
jgi:Ca-activated chloride channel family protein